jgi:hypothetical protein
MEVSHKCITKEAMLCMFYDEKIILCTKHRYIKNSLFCTLSVIDKLSTTMCNVFLIQKRIIKMRLGLGCRSSRRCMFKKLDILTVPSLYVFAVIIFVVRNPDHFKTISCICSIDTRQKINYIYHQWYFLQSKECYLFFYKNI